MSLAPERCANDAFVELYERVTPRARSVFFRFRIPAQDAEDLLQQSFLAFLVKRDAIVDAEAWLLGTLRNRCLMYWRSRRRQLYDAVDGAVLDLVAAKGAPQEQADLNRDLGTVMAGISSRCRSLLQLRYGLGCEMPETASRLSCSPSGIYKLTERCLAALTRRMVATGFVRRTIDV